MKQINLRECYPEHYSVDTFILVSDEVAAVLEEDKRRQKAYAEYIRFHKAFYSLDAGDGIEHEAVVKPMQPDEFFERMELARILSEALASLPEVQRRRIYAHIVLQKTKAEIAAAEGVDASTVRISIARGLRNLKKFLKNLL